jgi:hypothetical protein
MAVNTIPSRSSTYKIDSVRTSLMEWKWSGKTCESKRVSWTDVHATAGRWAAAVGFTQCKRHPELVGLGRVLGN